MKKKCPRCGGGLYPETDIYGTSLNCLQCGWNGELVKAPPLAYAHGRSTGTPKYYAKVRKN